MSDVGTDFRIALWVLRFLGFGGFGQDYEIMLGDIQERFSRRRSRLRFWAEVAGVVWRGALLTGQFRRLLLKRMAVWTIVGMGMFALGYRTAQRSFTAEMERKSAVENLLLARQLVANDRFLKDELARAQSLYQKEKTFEAMRQLQFVKARFDAAQYEYDEFFSRHSLNGAVRR
jgi:hypothetical protein